MAAGYPERGEQLRVPPHNDEAERSLLSAIFLDNRVLDDISARLSDQDLYREAHRHVFRAMLELYSRGEAIDVITLADHLAAQNLLDGIGGPNFLARLSNEIPSAANVVYYATIVRRKAALRNFITTATTLIDSCYEDVSDFEAFMDDAESKLFAITQSNVKRGYVTMREVIKEAFQQIESLYERQAQVTGVPSGFIDLDEITAGWQDSDLIIVAARPAMGKCLSAHSDVMLADGTLRTIEELYRARSAELVTLNDELRFESACASAFVDDGLKPVWRVTTKLGRRVESTASHPFLTIDGWMPLANLEVGQKIGVPRVLPFFGEAALPEYEVDASIERIAQGYVTTLPDFVFGLSRDALVAFLRRLFERGAWAQEPSPGVFHVDFEHEERLVRQVAHLLLRLGVVTSLEQSSATAGHARVSSVEVDADSSQIYWDEIASVEYLGRAQVYDLTVPGTHNFVANDICVHNTSLTLNMASHAAIERGIGVAFFSLEMSNVQLAIRMLCSEARVDQSKLRNGRMNEQEWAQLVRAAGALADSPIFLDDTPALPIMEFRSKARMLKSEHDIGIIFVDYLQLMKAPGRNIGSREQEISEISRNLKGIAKELSVPIIALAQLNRGVEARADKRPMNSDLRECVTGDTLVQLADGSRLPIASLVGTEPEVVALDPEGRLVYAASDKVWRVGEREVLEVRLRSGRSIRATAKHRLKTPDAWRRISELKVGEGIAVARELQETFWDEIIAIDPVGREPVYDLTVPGPASWLANDGIVSHNSGAIEQDADIISFIYRDEVYNPESDQKGIAEVILGKHRNGGLGTVRLRFFGQYTRFENLAPDIEEP
ncbi:MAG: replicative DNA helicase [Myxococcota bacterium]